ncbi:helix-turn-helix domain-containing protein [Amylolactobacillus amylophilus]|uniref:helix-turn-helix domain-containing protein n=1 Tax=Amylolactobacillus amylophilus TaxID=1603 RepID=UPI0006CF6B70|nr:transcriptional regulator [Amylolactobacillus amylophilus]
MKNGYGSTFHSMRKNKNYSLRDVSLDYISIAQLSKFERGDSDITLNKLAPLLDNITLSTSELYLSYPLHNLKTNCLFLKKLVSPIFSAIRINKS